MQSPRHVLTPQDQLKKSFPDIAKKCLCKEKISLDFGEMYAFSSKSRMVGPETYPGPIDPSALSKVPKLKQQSTPIKPQEAGCATIYAPDPH